MLFRTIASWSLLVSSALAIAEPAPYKLGSMSLNTAFGLAKRQAGYAPTETYCSPGADCAESCGTGYVQCASSDSQLHCYDPAIGQSCCSDGSGNSCDAGYFCTLDTSGGTWCCPNGMSLTDCAAAYSVIGGLFSETPAATLAASSSFIAAASTTSIPAAASTTSFPAAASTSTSSTVAAKLSTTVIDVTSTSSSTTSAFHPTLSSAAASSTIAASSTKTRLPLQSTGAAERVVVSGLGRRLLFAAGAILAL